MKRVTRIIVIVVSAAVVVLWVVPNAAAVATISSFSPSSGPAGCVVVITGTGFADFPAAQTTVTFVSPTAGQTPATSFVVASQTELRATVPGLTVGLAYNIRVTNPVGTTTSTGTFLATVAAGACGPTISSFSPTAGPVGTTVTIVGTNLLQDVNTGGDVTFFANKTAAPTGGPVSPTQLTVFVPDGATTGPINVMTPSGMATSVTTFTVVVGPPPPGGSSITVVTTTEPEVCAEVDTFGVPGPILPTDVSVSATSNLLVYFSSEWSGLNRNSELLLNFMVKDEEGNVVDATPFEWGVGNSPRLHDSGTVMWSFGGLDADNYTVFVDARTDPVPGPAGGGNPRAVIENCALTVFVNPIA